MSLYFMTFILFCAGVYGLVAKKNLVKKIVGLVIMENAVNLFLILLGFRKDGEAPILEKGLEGAVFVDPLPQAMILTSIVIGLGVVALLVAISVRIYEKYGTFDVSRIRELRG
jgi:multicomponent Na+:H+ antiporter subunit C